MRVLTIGGGPCGLHASRLLQLQGHDVTVLEEHASIGAPVNCAGLVGTQLIGRYGDSSVINRIDGANVHCGGKCLELRRKGVAHVIDRTSFDASFSEGLDIAYSARAVSIGQDSSGTYHVRTGDATYVADLVIGADGPYSIVRKSLHFSGSVTLHGAYQQRVRMEDADEHVVTVELKRPFFSWAIPEGDGVVRVGLVGKVSELERFKGRHGISGEVLESFAAPIPVGKTELVSGRVALVGDAAAQTKPLSGGGLLYGLRAAELLASAVENGNLAAYQSCWKQEFGREMSFGLSARKIYESMSQKDLERIFDVLCDNKERIESEGDYDNHSSLARIFIGNPRLLAVLGKNLLSLF